MDGCYLFFIFVGLSVVGVIALVLISQEKGYAQAWELASQVIDNAKIGHDYTSRFITGTYRGHQVKCVVKIDYESHHLLTEVVAVSAIGTYRIIMYCQRPLRSLANLPEPVHVDEDTIYWEEAMSAPLTENLAKFNRQQLQDVLELLHEIIQRHAV